MSQIYFVSGKNSLGKTQWMLRHFGYGGTEGSYMLLDRDLLFQWRSTRFAIGLVTEAKTQLFRRINVELHTLETSINELKTKRNQIDTDMHLKTPKQTEYNATFKAMKRLLRPYRDSFGIYREETLPEKIHVELTALRAKYYHLETEISPYSEKNLRRIDQQLESQSKQYTRLLEHIKTILRSRGCDIFLEISCHGTEMAQQLADLRAFCTECAVPIRHLFLNGGVGWNILQNIQCHRVYEIPNFKTSTMDILEFRVPDAEYIYIENRIDSNTIQIEPIKEACL